MLGVATGSHEHWEQAVDLYLDIPGLRGSKAAVYGLSELVGALGRCAICPLNMFETGSSHICRDEVLVTGLIAGIAKSRRRCSITLPVSIDLRNAL